MFQINDTHPGTDIAAQTAAAFAACSNLYSHRALDGSTFSTPASLRDDSYSDTLLTHAQQLYKFAVNATGGRKVYQKSVPEAAEAYPSTDYGDELAIAALFLSWATGDATMYQEAEAHWDRYKLAGARGVFNWDSKAPGLPVLFSQISKSFPSITGNLSTWQGVAEEYFDSIVDRKNSPAFMTKGTTISLARDFILNIFNKVVFCTLTATRTARVSTRLSMSQCFCAGFQH